VDGRNITLLLAEIAIFMANLQLNLSQGNRGLMVLWNSKYFVLCRYALLQNPLVLGKDRKWNKAMYAFRKNVDCIPLAVVIMTTANGMHPTFSGRHTQLFIISDFYRSLATSHGDCRSPLYPCYVKYWRKRALYLFMRTSAKRLINFNCYRIHLSN